MATSMKSGTTKKSKVDSKKDVLEQQDVLQAVVIADNFNEHFAPLSKEKPFALFPLVNKPLLDYALEALTECGIQETFVFCSAHPQQIRNHVNLNWSSCSSSMAVSVFSSDAMMSVGDAIRELDSKALIRSDFVLINGSITTLPLISVLEQHKKCRKVDKGCAMTLFYRQVLPKHKTRCKEDNVMIAVESKSKKIRFYQKAKKKKTLHIPLEVFQENEEVSIHYDLLDCHMCICSPTVPPLYSDNFDYQTFDDLVRGLIVNEEILGNSMYLYLAETGYGAGVRNLFMYDAVSRDIVQRWTYPLVPDMFNQNGLKFMHLRSNVYKDKDVDLHRMSVLKKNVVIGKGTTIAENTYIENTIIGQNCRIGANVRIIGSYLWNDVIIGDNCCIENSLLADKVVLKENVNVASGCVLSFKVVIGDYVNVPPLTKLQFDPPEEEDGFDLNPEDDIEASILKSSPACDPNFVGISGHGYLFVQAKDDLDEDDEEVKDVWGEVVKEEDPEDDDGDSNSESCTASHDDAENVDDEENQFNDDEDTELFYNEVLDSLQRGIEEKVKSENLILEINSSKYAYNVTMKEVNSLFTKAILKIPLEADQEHTAQSYFAKLKPILLNFLPLIKNYIKNAASQYDCLVSIEEFFVSNEELSAACMKLLHILYEKEVLGENVILKWFENLSSYADVIKVQIEPFMRWLREADEESSSSEEN